MSETTHNLSIYINVYSYMYNTSFEHHEPPQYENRRNVVVIFFFRLFLFFTSRFRVREVCRRRRRCDIPYTFGRHRETCRIRPEPTTTSLCGPPDATTYSLRTRASSADIQGVVMFSARSVFNPVCRARV